MLSYLKVVFSGGGQLDPLYNLRITNPISTLYTC